MSSAREKGFNFLSFIAVTVFLIVVSVVAGICLNIFVFDNGFTLGGDGGTLAIVIFMCAFLFYILTASNKDDHKFKGKKDMENQHFASIQELNKNFKHCWFSDLKGFFPSLFPINDITYLRNVIAYVNRNGYLVDRNTTPFSYKWGANRYFFSPLNEYETLLKSPLSDISINAKRKIFHTHFNGFPENYYLIEGYISPLCYVGIEEAESIFKSAHHYYSLVSRQVEMFSSISNQVGDMIVYTDEELSSVLYSICKARYGCKPFDIEKNAKIELAKELHFKYNASNQQIRRVMRLDIDVVNALFKSFSSR
jgi:hypothetical protein